MVDATPVRTWMVAQTRRRIVRLALDQANRPGLRTTTNALLGLGHPHVQPGMASTI
jgi:hypothetical protein